MNLSVPYNLEFVNVVAGFLEEIGTCFGADVAERQQLRLIGEEAFSFIMVGIPEQDFSEMFQLRCSALDDGLSLFFSNHGKPMNVREVKEFSYDDIEGTADSLSLRMLHGLCNELSFSNLGRQGWGLVISFQISHFRPVVNKISATANEGKSSRGDFVVRKTAIADIPSVINLVYSTYRYSYAKSFAYSPELFEEAIANGKIFSMVIVEGEKIIGHQAVIFESQWLGEVGMAMIHPQYRRSRAFLLMKREMTNELKQAFPGLLFFIKAVTSHESSQAFMSGFTISMLELSVYNHASFIGMETHANSRESLVYGYATLSAPSEIPQLFVPLEHLEFLLSMAGRSTLPLSILPNNRTELPAESQHEQLHDAERQTGRIYFKSIGEDFRRVLQKQTRLLQQEGVVTIFAILPTDENQPVDLDQVLFSNGFFFSGIKPNAKGKWDLVYTNLLYQKFEFDRLQLFSPQAVELCTYMKELYLAVS